jgi:hypothetical protein
MKDRGFLGRRGAAVLADVAAVPLRLAASRTFSMHWDALIAGSPKKIPKA